MSSNSKQAFSENKSDIDRLWKIHEEWSGVGSGVGRRPADVESIVDESEKRFHGSVELDSTRVGRDAGRIAEEVLSHLSGLVGAEVRVTLEVEAQIPDGAPESVVRTMTENSQTLKFTSHGFELE